MFMIRAMDRPLTSSKLLLVADPRAGLERPTATPIRRYRLARLRLAGPPSQQSDRFEHLKRVFD
jgi:hypothetical protein